MIYYIEKKGKYLQKAKPGQTRCSFGKIKDNPQRYATQSGALARLYKLRDNGHANLRIGQTGGAVTKKSHALRRVKKKTVKKAVKKAVKRNPRKKVSRKKVSRKKTVKKRSKKLTSRRVGKEIQIIIKS